MVDTTFHTLSALFALVSGTAAGLLSLLFWRVLRESPFGTVIALLSGTMSAMIVYHVILFLVEPNTLLLDTLRSALYTVIAIFLWLVIVTHQQIDSSAVER
jgi:Na+-transporting NADH:ubiquinone oxidoreductase subunit NqrE